MAVSKSGAQGTPAKKASSPAPEAVAAPAPKKAVKTPKAGSPGQDAIQARAWEIFLARQANGQSGDHQSDWYQAESELGK